jgi:hypothetical protein
VSNRHLGLKSPPPLSKINSLRGLPNGLFLSGFLFKTLYAFCIPIFDVACPAHLILHEFLTGIMNNSNYGAPHYSNIFDIQVLLGLGLDD